MARIPAKKQVQTRFKPEPPYKPTYMRQYRLKARMTLEAAGEVVGLSHAQLGRIERGVQPYNQELLEALADLYGTSPASIINRDPSKPGIWSIWDQAAEAERQKIEEYADLLVKKRTGT